MLGMLRRRSNNRFKVLARLLETPLLPRNPAQLIMRVRVLGVLTDRPSELRLSLLLLSSLLVEKSEIEVG